MSFYCNCCLRRTLLLRNLIIYCVFFPQDYNRPSVEEILENPLIADLVAEEQRRNLERRGRQLGEPEKLQDSSPVLSELKLKEIQLQERERALKAREERLERKSEWGSKQRRTTKWVILMCLNISLSRIFYTYRSY